MPNIEHTSHIHTEAQDEQTEATASLKTKLFVVVFKDFMAGEPTIITRRHKQLLTGTRTEINPDVKYDKCPSVEYDATEIARKHQITTSAHAWLHLPDGPIPYTQGYSVQRANHSPLPNMADFTNHPTPTEHDLPLEIHTLANLIKELDGQPGRETEVAYLKAFGKFVLNHPR